jgi:hypothetical protein
MKAPVYLYYELYNFYTNHKDFVISRKFSQLRGEVYIDSTNNTKCDGARYVKEIFDNDSSRYKTFTGKPLNGDDFANPCGLVAKSVFNDTFEFYDNTNSTKININETDIANNFDKQFMFKRNPEYDKLQWVDVEDGIT